MDIILGFSIVEGFKLAGSANQGCLTKLAADLRSFGRYDRTALNRLDNCFASTSEIFGEGFSLFHTSNSSSISAKSELEYQQASFLAVLGASKRGLDPT